jgi:hypothetical protein
VEAVPGVEVGFLQPGRRWPHQQRHLRRHGARDAAATDAHDEGDLVPAAEDRHDLRCPGRGDGRSVQGTGQGQAQAGHRKRGLEPGEDLRALTSASGGLPAGHQPTLFVDELERPALQAQRQRLPGAGFAGEGDLQAVLRHTPLGEFTRHQVVQVHRRHARLPQAGALARDAAETPAGIRCDVELPPQHAIRRRFDLRRAAPGPAHGAAQQVVGLRTLGLPG